MHVPHFADMNMTYLYLPVYSRYSILSVESGRQAVIDADGVRVLYRTCEDIMDVRELESLIFIASLILRKCFPRQKLPANANKTTLLYKLPQSDFHTPFGLSKGNQVANTCQGSYIY